MENLLKFCEPVLSDDTVLDFVLENYELPGVTSNSVVELLKNVKPEVKVTCSSVFVLDRRYFLKENILDKLNRDLAIQELVPQLLDELDKQEIRVLVPYRTKGGEGYASASGHRFEVVDFLQEATSAVSIETREADLVAAATELARFHKAKLNLDLVNAYENKKDFFWGGRSDGDFSEELKRQGFVYGCYSGRYDKEIRRCLDLVLEDYETMKSSFQVNYKMGVLHRDCHTKNILFNKQREVMALVDWDISKYGPFVHDLAYSLDSFSSNKKDPFAQPNLKHAELFLNTYLKEHSLPEEDVKHLFDPLRNDMVDRTLIFMRADYGADEAFRSDVVASHISLHWRMRILEKILR